MKQTSATKIYHLFHLGVKLRSGKSLGDAPVLRRKSNDMDSGREGGRGVNRASAIGDGIDAAMGEAARTVRGKNEKKEGHVLASRVRHSVAIYGRCLLFCDQSSARHAS